MTPESQPTVDSPVCINRRTFLSLSAACSAGIAASGAYSAQIASPGIQKPNIVVIVVDDLGYGDLSIHGCKDIATPQIDAIANAGVRFTHGYVSCPVCSPTRAGLLTGRYQQRFGHEFNPGPNADRSTFGLPTSEVTLANLLKSAGYATGMVGKWHLGFSERHVPTARGFEEFYGFLGGAHSYLKLDPSSPDPIFRGTGPVEEKEHLTDAFAREASEYIKRHKDHPFFLYLTFNAVHNPLEPDPRYLEQYADIADERRRKYAALLKGLDDAVGRVTATLRETGLEENTLLFFISDNGGPTQNGSTNATLRETKGTVFEGGIRVPFFVRWKGRLAEGGVYDKPVIALDILPTAVAAANAEIPGDREYDGVNLLPYLAGTNNGYPHELLYWRFGAQSAVRSSDFKLVRRDGVEMLFNLVSDSAERNDLSKSHPDELSTLKAAYEQWESKLIAPLWVGRTQRART
ncbi:MAG: sulfatase [Candidatus Hydrogenedentota bacterium]